jgi:hypothetical protein
MVSASRNRLREDRFRSNSHSTFVHGRKFALDLDRGRQVSPTVHLLDDKVDLVVIQLWKRR